MTVVINEFEVIAEPPPELPPQAQPTPGRAQTEEKQPVRATHVLHIVERQRQRLQRLYAD